GVAEAGDALAEPRDPKRRRPHVDAAPASAEIERDPDDVNGLGRHNYFARAGRLTVTDMPSLPGDTMLVYTFASFWIAARKSRISPSLFTTLWARNRPRGRRRGSTMS